MRIRTCGDACRSDHGLFVFSTYQHGISSWFYACKVHDFSPIRLPLARKNVLKLVEMCPKTNDFHQFQLYFLPNPPPVATPVRPRQTAQPQRIFANVKKN